MTVPLNSVVGNTVSVSQQITVSTSSGTVSYLAYNSNNANTWLGLASSCTSSSCATASSLSLTAPNSFYIVANPTNLSTGNYTGQVIVQSQNSNLTITVNLVVSTVGLGAQLPLTLTYQQNSTTYPSINLPLSGPATQYTINPGNCTFLVFPTTNLNVPGALIAPLNNSVAPTLTPNTYNCSFTITPANSTNTPMTIPVVLTVTGAFTLTASPSSIAMNFQNGTGSTAYPAQTVTLTGSGTQSVGYSVQAGITDSYTGPIWFTVSKSSGTLSPSDTFTVAYNGVSLQANTYHGQITVSANNTQQNIPVTLLVANSPLLNVTPSGVAFTAELNGSSPAPVTVEATATSGSPAVSVIPSATSGGNWLFAAVGATITSATSVCPAPPCVPITISVNTSGLGVGTYKGTVAVSANNTTNNPQNVSVTLTVANDALISTNMSTSQPLVFAFQTGAGSTAPPAQNVTVSSTTGATLSYTAVAANTTSSGCPATWLTLTGGTTSGNTSGTFTVSASPSGISAPTSGPACTGTITITATNPTTGNAAPNSPYVIPVELFVSPNALLTVNPSTSPAFSAQTGLASSAVSQNCSTNGTSTCTLTLGNTSSTDPISITVIPATTDNTGWLSAGITSASLLASSPATLTISLAFIPPPGSYSGTVTVNGAAHSGSPVLDSPLVIPVSLQVTAGAPTVNPPSLSFSQTAGGSAPGTQTISVGSTGQAIAFTAGATVTQPSTGTQLPNWLTVSPTSGTTPASLTVSVSAANLAASATPYQGNITITAAGSSNSVTVPVQFTVNPGTISATPATLTFSQVQGGSAPATQTISVSGTPGAINFSATAATNSGGNWLSVSPSSGTTPGTVTVTVNGSSLTPNTYTGTVMINSPGATGSPITINVSFTVTASQTITASPATLTFSAVAGIAPPAAQTVSITSSGSGTSFTAAATTQTGGNWLSVTPTSGVTPAQLSIAVASQSLTAGNYTGTVAINSPNIAAPVNITVNLTVASIPTPVITAVQNAASYAIGGVSPGENIYIKGTGIGPATLMVAAPSSSGAYPTNFGNTQVFFGTVAAPILYVSATATSVMVPYEVAGQPTTSVTVVYSGVTSAPITYSIVAAAPGIYTLNQSGTGPGAILNQNYSVNGPTAPAAPGSVVAVYMTGEGPTSPPSTTGALASATNPNTWFKPTLPVTATIGGLPATVQYYGSAPGLIYGVMQVNLSIPSGLSNGAQPVVISVGTFQTQANVTVTVQSPTSSAEPQ